MKHMYVPADTMVFDIESQGDLFYMVICGKVLCKVPFLKQVIHLSEDEKKLFTIQLKDDLRSITEATDINQQIARQEAEISGKKATHFAE